MESNIFKSDSNYTLNESKWIDWTVPTLTGTVPEPGVPVVPSNTPTPTKPPYTPTPTKIANPEDVNRDGVVNMADALLIATVFNSTRGDNKYKVECDLDNNGVVNMADILAIASKFGKTFN